MKYLRKKDDGFVYDFSEHLLARGDMDTFEFVGNPPERIEDLVEFLSANKPAKAPKADKAAA